MHSSVDSLRIGRSHGYFTIDHPVAMLAKGAKGLDTSEASLSSRLSFTKTNPWFAQHAFLGAADGFALEFVEQSAEKKPTETLQAPGWVRSTFGLSSASWPGQLS